jgi:hypothetical protein
MYVCMYVCMYVYVQYVQYHRYIKWEWSITGHHNLHGAQYRNRYNTPMCTTCGTGREFSLDITVY